jgi:hypothetical protein
VLRYIKAIRLSEFIYGPWYKKAKNNGILGVFAALWLIVFLDNRGAVDLFVVFFQTFYR